MSIPKFRSEDAEREFWSSHDSTEFVDWSKARRVALPNLKPSTRTISLRLPEAMLDQLRLLANRSDVPYQSLLKVFLAERLRDELLRTEPESECRWIRFTIGEAFPRKSLLAVWVAGLATVANDLATASDPIFRVERNVDKQADHTYFFWLTCAQYREAAKFVASGLDEEEIARFNRQLPPDTKELLQFVRGSFEPWENSFVETVLKPIRDHLFHYPKVRSREWKEVLEAHSQTSSSVRLEGAGRIRDTRGFFADDIRASLLSHHLGNGPEDWSEAMDYLASLVGALVRYSHEVLAHYLVGLPKESVRIEVVRRNRVVEVENDEYLGVGEGEPSGA